MKKINTKGKTFRIIITVLTILGAMIIAGAAYAMFLVASFFSLAGPGDGYKPLGETEFRNLDNAVIKQESAKARDLVQKASKELRHRLSIDKSQQGTFVSETDGCYPKTSVSGIETTHKAKVCAYRQVLVFGSKFTREELAKRLGEIGWETSGVVFEKYSSKKTYQLFLAPLEKDMQNTDSSSYGSQKLSEDSFTLYTKKELFKEEEAQKKIQQAGYKNVLRLVLTEIYYSKNIWQR